MSRRIYADPPVEEALCEFRFAEEPEWHPLLTPSSFRGALEGTHSGSPQPLEEWEASFSRGADTTTSLAIRQKEAGYRFPDTAGRNLVALAPGRFAIHTLRPYGGWEDFRARIAAGLNVYLDVRKPGRLLSATIRYINKISIPHTSIRLDEFFNAVPASVSGLPRVGSFLQKTEYVYEDDVRLSVTFTDGQPGPRQGDGLEFLLDLEVSWQPKDGRGTTEAMAIVDDLRYREREAFEALVGDRARELFHELRDQD